MEWRKGAPFRGSNLSIWSSISGFEWVNVEAWTLPYTRGVQHTHKFGSGEAGIERHTLLCYLRVGGYRTRRCRVSLSGFFAHHLNILPTRFLPLLQQTFDSVLVLRKNRQGTKIQYEAKCESHRPKTLQGHHQSPTTVRMCKAKSESHGIHTYYCRERGGMEGGWVSIENS